MGFPIIGLLTGALKTVGRIAGIDIFDKASDALEKLQLSPEKAAELQAALNQHMEEMRRLDIDELKAVISESTAMIQSPDKFVARARPMGLYAAYVCSIGLIAALIWGIKIDPTAILTIMGPMFGAQGYYMHLRTKEKMNGNGGD